MALALALASTSTSNGHAAQCRAALLETIAADAGRTASVYECSRAQAPGLAPVTRRPM